MKKALFPLMALAIGLILAPLLSSFTLPAGAVLAAEDDPEVCVSSLSEGLGMDVTLKDSANNTWIMWVGAFRLTVDGEEYFGWCTDIDIDIDEGCFNASLSDADRATPWCEISHIVTNYTPDSADEAAAIQLAIWKHIYGRLSIIATDPATVETRALEIYDDAEGKSVLSLTPMMAQSYWSRITMPMTPTPPMEQSCLLMSPVATTASPRIQLLRDTS